jgi:two-component system nitrate/nitrite response regulator NarL
VQTRIRRDPRRQPASEALATASPVTRRSLPRRTIPRVRDPIRILLIEDNWLACEQLARLLDGQPAFEVVAKAASTASGLERVRESRPQVALVDADLANGDCRRLLQSAREAAPDARMIVMDVLPGNADIIGFIEAGAHGFILKDATADAVVATIEAVAKGQDVLPSPLTSTLWSRLVHPATAPTPPSDPGTDARLTTRESEITSLIGVGLANKEIGHRLGIATHTVKSHVHNILQKLGLRTRLEVAVHGRRRGACDGNPIPGYRAGAGGRIFESGSAAPATRTSPWPMPSAAHLPPSRVASASRDVR